MLTKQYDQLIRDTVLDGWNEKRLSVLQCAFAAVEAVLAQRTEPAPAAVTDEMYVMDDPPRQFPDRLKAMYSIRKETQ